MELTLPARVSLASLPTRVAPMDRLGLELGGPRLSVKRDDQTGSDLSGNKVRKLEYLLAEARARKATTVVTCGAVQSNHCRATAVAARQLGMDSFLVLRGEEPAVADGNFLLDRMVGARCHFISDDEWKGRREIMAACAARLEGEGEAPYVIPEGGSNGLGSWGYISMLAELLDDDGRVPYTHIVCAVGSGGTLAGLVLGKKIMDLDLRILAVNVCDDAAYFQRRVEEIAADFNANGKCRIPVGRDDYTILEGYKGPGYGIPYEEQIRWMKKAARIEGLLLDPVYTGKAFYGLVDQIGKGRFSSADHVLFLHTGGLFGLFPHGASFSGE